MTTEQTATNQSYVFDQSRLDHERLVRQARRLDAFALQACVRAGLQPGARAIDVGCGPLGALPVLRELVGPDGSVVGLDANPAALVHAREKLDESGLLDIELVHADVNSLDETPLAASREFDLAYCRLVLMYQPDPAATLHQIARLVRPGGRIVSSDILYDPRYPRAHPPVAALERTIRLFYALVERKGGTLDVVQQYRRICEQAGLRYIDQHGWFWCSDPRELLVWYCDNLLGMRGNLVAHNLATEEEVNVLVREMETAQETVEFAATNLIVDMITEVP